MAKLRYRILWERGTDSGTTIQSEEFCSSIIGVFIRFLRAKKDGTIRAGYMFGDGDEPIFRTVFWDHINSDTE